MASVRDHFVPSWLIVICICSMFAYAHEFSVNQSKSGTSQCSPLDGGHERTKRLLMTKKFRHWPKGVLPYKFLGVEDRNAKDILASMAIYEYFTPIRFVPWEKSLVSTLGHPGFLKFKTTWGRGWSLLGFANDENGQWIECPILLTCIHEIGHALGFQHEQYHPERDRWIRVNKNNLFEFDTWDKIGWSSTYIHTHFDMSSVMLYGPGPWELYDFLFPELVFEPRYFYFLKELCIVYECEKYPQCLNHKLTCANGGFVSVVDDRCGCVCPQGLDPKNGCMDSLKKGPSDWPVGQFSLFEHKDGCPQSSFQTGLWRHYGKGRNKKFTDNFKGVMADPKAEISFCTQTTPSAVTHRWPLGAYCFLKKGTCPNQIGFHEAKILIPGRKDTSKNVYSGALPTGTYKTDTTLEFCCVQSGFSYIPASFPTEKPFILFPVDGYSCQNVDGMHVEMEKVGLSHARVVGGIRRSTEKNLIYLHYCVYKPLKRDCGGVIEMGPNRRSFVIQSDQSDTSFTECTWFFKGPNTKDILVFAFDEFNVKSSDTKCDNRVEVQPTLIAQKGTVYCDKRKDKSIQSLLGEMLVRFRNGNSNSTFKATVKWIADKEICYDSKDNGWSYRGKVNYTRMFEPCIAWSEVTSCLHNSFTVGDYQDGLDGNYCRNPDNSFRPWCYTKVEGCRRNFCDVCQLEKPYDRSDDCAERKRNGLCTNHDIDCAESCNVQLTTINGLDVRCRHPGTVSGGVFKGPNKQSYNLGDKVTFRCTKSGNIIERTCLSTGEWTEANTACLPCPLGFHHYRHSCYKFYYKFLVQNLAMEECKKVGAVLAMPKTEGENSFVDSLRYRLNRVWLGGRNDTGNYMWADKTPIKWFNWKFFDVPHIEPCIYLMVSGYWHSTISCDWEFNFVCQRPVTDDKPDCKDFLDNCPSLVSSAPDANCDEVPGLDTYCRYSCGLCPRDCDQVVQMSKASPKYTVSSDRRRKTHKLCTWTIQAPGNEEGRLAYHFDEFQVDASGDRCVDSVEVRESEYGAPYIRHCGTNYTKSGYINNNEMFIRFRTPGTSKSNFKLTITWIPDSEMCYNVKDKGKSYNGNVNYTETLQPCLSWSQALSCGNNTLQFGSFLDSLEDNYCRNHDHSARPWCYDEDCEKQYCDVCHLKLPLDTSSNCEKFKNDGQCSTDPYRAATECSETCKETLKGALKKVSSTTCSTPSRIYGGYYRHLKSRYAVGQRVRYRCWKNKRFVKRTCTTSGTWTEAKTACLDCPFGFIPFKSTCYRYFNKYLDKAGAQNLCGKYGSVVATPKNTEENDFISSLRNNERIWLGGIKATDSFKWNDGTKITWLNWWSDKRRFSERDDCMVMEKDARWTDDWCKNKLFHFVCQADRHTDGYDCVDYFGNCPTMIEAIPEPDCASYPSLQVYCPFSCRQCSKDCNNKIQLSSTYPMYTITGDHLCTWNFKGDDKNGRFIITFKEFNVNSPDSLTMQLSQFGELTHKYSGNNYQKVTYLSHDNLWLSLKSAANSNSRFKATVKWMRDADLCYEMKDKGWSYNGKVNYTKEFQPCLPWAEALECPHNPLKNGDFLDNLDGNYCRNPDQSDQPWCYTRKCEKQYCDVCHLEEPVDRSNNCGQRMSSGLCTLNSIDCAQTCQIARNQNKVSETKCGPPGPINGGAVQGSIKSSYNVGERVMYACTKNSFQVERFCLSSGDWSVANTACLSCPYGFTHFRGNCYRLDEKSLQFTDAMVECEKYDAWIATPKSMEENSFVYSFSFKSRKTISKIWLGAEKRDNEGNFYWLDNTPFVWTNWVIREPFKKRHTCIFMENSQRWDDDSCHKSTLNFVCQRKADDKPECKDFLDNCPHLLSLTKEPMCNPDSRMVTLCRYTCGLCPRDCDRNIRLSQSNPSYVVRADRRQQSHRYCTWNFKGLSYGRFVIEFEDFDVKSSGEHCKDVVEISQSEYGPSQSYCNGKDTPFLEVINDRMIIRFRTPERSQSHFRAKVKWIDDTDMCYNVKDKGHSYNGKVNYTVSFQPCLPWSQALKCPYHPLKEENFQDNLHENYCRNPDQSNQPWCYVNQCERKYCDVCHIEKPRDMSKNCASFKTNHECTKDPHRALKECAATCKAVSTKPVPKVSDIRCGPPEVISRAALQGQQKQSYHVGDTVTYKCSKGSSSITRTCLTSGDWSEAKTACLICPTGWTLYNNKCYRYFEQFIQYHDAHHECKIHSAIIATSKSAEKGKFLSKYCPKDDQLWLGLKKNKISKKFSWNDGGSLTWTNWVTEKSENRREDCVLMGRRGKWRDDWCKDKYYSFVCQMDSDDNPDCKDFVARCPQLVQLKDDKKCDSVLNKFCRRTCNACRAGG